MRVLFAVESALMRISRNVREYIEAIGDLHANTRTRARTRTRIRKGSNNPRRTFVIANGQGNGPTHYFTPFAIESFIPTKMPHNDSIWHVGISANDQPPTTGQGNVGWPAPRSARPIYLCNHH